MAAQYREDFDHTPILRFGDAIVKDNEIVLQDAGRTEDLAYFTVMARGADKKLVPLTSLSATDGTSIPVGLMAETIAYAKIVAGDVSNVVLYRKTGRVDEASIVLENSLDLDDIIVDRDQTIRDLLIQIDIIPETGLDIDRPENS